jgi:hypothetical protein
MGLGTQNIITLKQLLEDVLNIGPGGFLAGFYQKSWDVVNEKVCEFVKDVWKNPSIISEANQTDICLIP